MVARNITVIKKAEELKIENMQLELASKAKSDFLASMSHELRAPLNSIIGFTDILKQQIPGELNEEQKHYLDNIKKSSDFLLALIDDILDLSKIEAGKMELKPEAVHVPSVIEETLVLIKEKAARHNIVIKKELDPELVIITADTRRVKQILFNLLSNAVKFSKKEGGEITVTTKKVGDMAQISISDTGIGIKEEDMGELFKAFRQLDPDRNRRYGGTGLGLSISKKIADLHGGTIRAESKFNEGSTFTFQLPVRQ